jgi:glucokinase
MYLGIEIGGTKLQLGLGAGDGVLAALRRLPVDVMAGGDGIRRQIQQAVPELLHAAGVERAAVRGVGIGFGGPVDDATRRVLKSHQVEGWSDYPLAEWVERQLGWPAVLGNDADVAGLAEALFGAGRGLSPIFYITIGSGIGGGLIIDGEIYRGCGKGAAEIGHLRVGVAYDYYVSTLEQESSGWAIGRKAARELMTRQPASDAGLILWRLVNGDVDKLTAEHVAHAAAQGDRLAETILTGAWVHLAEAICQVIALLCPRRIVIGGGVSLMGERLLFQPLRRLVAERVFPPFADCSDIVPAALGEAVVVHGALALARKRLAAAGGARGRGGS